MLLENFVQTFIFVLMVFQCILSVCCEEKTFMFDVKPGGDTHSVAEKLGDVTCSFTYSSQGGTKESWSMVMTKQTDYTCDVLRPDNIESYLMFEKFELKIEGAKLRDAVVWLDKDMKEAAPHEYEKDYTASAVRSTSRFGNKMHRVVALASGNKEDL